MSEEIISYFSVGVQAGDSDANQVVAPLYLSLRRSLSENCQRGYGEKLKEIAFVLRIDGKIWHWEKSGCENLKIKKAGLASIDIFMPITVWQNRTPKEIMLFIKNEITIGFFLILEKLKARKIEFDEINLIRDFETAINEWSSQI